MISLVRDDDEGEIEVAPRRSWPDFVNRRTAIYALFVAMILIAVVTIGSLVSLRGALDDARLGRDAAGELNNGFDMVGALDETRSNLERAEGHFSDANGHLNSPWLAVGRRLPYIGKQIRSADALAESGAQASSLAIVALDEASVVIDGDTDDRVALVTELGAIAKRARDGLTGIELGPADGLHDRLDEARTTFADQLAEADADLAVVQEIADGMHDVLTGPTSFLLLVGNNAEMRGGSGSFLSAGVVTFRDGDIEVDQLSSVHDYDFERAAVLGSDPGTPLWTDITHTTDWQLLGSSPRFDWTAPLALRMWQAANSQQLNGVVAVDAAVLEAMLRITGPVEVGGTQFSADEILFELLYNQYFSVTSDDYRAYDETQLQRRDRLGSLASESLIALEERDIDLQQLIEHLREAIAGRHLMVWSADEQDLWRTLGVDGELDENSLALSLLNAGGNKLDYWTEIFAELVVGEVDPQTDRVPIEVSTRVVVDPPPDAPRYVVGPHPDIAENAGDYIGVLSLHVPAGATDIEVVSGQPIRARGTDGPTQAVLVDVELAAGTSSDVVIRFSLPASAGFLTVEPSARIPATRWLHGETRWRSGAAVEILLLPVEMP